MIASALFRKTLDAVTAMQWTGSDECAESLWEWTNRVIATRDDGSPSITSARFMVLQDWANSDAEETFGEVEEQRRVDAGYTAVVFDDASDEWSDLRTGDWIVKREDGSLRAVPRDEFEATYTAV